MQSTDTPEVWIIVALSRPRQASFIRWQFERFTYPDKKIIIVESKAGKGACLESGFTPDILIQADGTAGACKNAALDRLDEEGASGYWATMDDDDFYGVDYIEKHLELWSTAGKPINIGNYDYVVMNEGMVKFDVVSETILGASIGGELPCQKRFAATVIGEERTMLNDRSAVGAGSLPVAVSRLGCPRNHTWKAHVVKIIGMHESGRICSGGTVHDYLEGRAEPDSNTTPSANIMLNCKESTTVELGLPDGITYEI